MSWHFSKHISLKLPEEMFEFQNIIYTIKKTFGKQSTVISLTTLI